MMNAVLYGRWSTLEQGTHGRSTLERQALNTRSFAEAKGWRIINQFHDAGKSAYTGENITKGKLGRFAKSVLRGEIDAAETVLVVEELEGSA